MVATKQRPSRDEPTRSDDANTTHAKSRHDNDTPERPLRIHIDEEIEKLRTIGDEREKYRALCTLFARVKTEEREQEEVDEWTARHSFDPTQNLETVFDDEPRDQYPSGTAEERTTSKASSSWADAVRKPRLTHAQPANNGKRHIPSTPQVGQTQPQTTCDDDDDASESEESTRETRDYSPWEPRGISYPLAHLSNNAQALVNISTVAATYRVEADFAPQIGVPAETRFIYLTRMRGSADDAVEAAAGYYRKVFMDTMPTVDSSATTPESSFGKPSPEDTTNRMLDGITKILEQNNELNKSTMATLHEHSRQVAAATAAQETRTRNEAMKMDYSTTTRQRSR